MMKLFNEQENLGTTSVTICHAEPPLIHASNRFLINTINFFFFFFLQCFWAEHQLAGSTAGCPGRGSSRTAQGARLCPLPPNVPL